MNAIRHHRLFNISPQNLNDMVFSEMTDLAVLLSPDWKISRVSRSTEMLLGYQAGELIGKPIDYIVKDQSILACTLDNRKDPVVRRYNETQCLASTGELIPVKISCLPLLTGRLNVPEGIVLIGQDIRVTKQLEKQIEQHLITEDQLRQSEERFKAIFYQNTAIMYLIDTDTLEIFDANKTARDYYGYSEEEFKNLKITEINGYSEEDMHALIKKQAEEKLTAYYFKHRLASGEWRDVEINTTSLSMNERKMLISIVRDITDRKKAEEKIAYLAYHDTLTGLANRKYFYERLHQELERSIRIGNKLAILFLDLDGFKLVNDTYGHEVGDLLLKEVAKRIKANIRETDLVARMGGDEFTLLILDILNLDAAKTAAQKLSDVLGRPFMLENNPVHVQASIGISIFPDDGGDMNLLLSKADNEMYTVKRAKKCKKETLLI